MMNTKYYDNQRGASTPTILFIILIGVIITLIYILAGGDNQRIGRTYGTPNVQSDPTTAPTFSDTSTDGLGQPTDITNKTLDEFGAGISKLEIFNYDMNNDGQMDTITRIHHETGNAHAYDEYKLELNQNGKMIDITPDGFRTVNGAECALQHIKFISQPYFHVIRISRPWSETWDTPSMATKNIYRIDGNKMKIESSEKMDTVCDVRDLL